MFSILLFFLSPVASYVETTRKPSDNLRASFHFSYTRLRLLPVIGNLTRLDLRLSGLLTV